MSLKRWAVNENKINDKSYSFSDGETVAFILLFNVWNSRDLTI